VNAYILSDKDYMTGAYSRLLSQAKNFLHDFDIEEKRIGKDDLHYCMGCFGCWVKKPGECVIHDDITNINHAMMNSDVVIYLCPVVFGQFSANIKHAIDRWLPNMLPFFEVRKDGSTMHPRRYESYPRQIMIGYGDHLNNDDTRLFIDITQKHRTNIIVLVDDGTQDQIKKALEQISLRRVAGGAL